MSGALAGWDRSVFTAAGYSRAVYRRGAGPGVVVIHEIPGITPSVLRFADDVVNAGFTVAMPLLVGEAGRPVSAPYLARSTARLCVSREFVTWATGRTSPIVGWLRALARHLHDDAGGRGVGAVGMCFSGGFALGMMVDEVMLAPVLSQPSLPIAVGLPGGRSHRGSDLGLSADDAVVVAQRAREGCQVLGLRFVDDPLVGAERFAALRALLGDALLAVELPSRSRRDHSVLTEQRDDGAVERVLAFLTAQLA